MKARLAKGPDWEVTSAWLAGGKVLKSSSGEVLKSSSFKRA